MKFKVSKILELLRIIESQEHHLISVTGLIHLYFPYNDYAKQYSNKNIIFIYRYLKILVERGMLKCISTRQYDQEFLGFEYIKSGNIRIKNIHFLMTNLGSKILQNNVDCEELKLLTAAVETINLISIPLFGKYIPHVGSNH